MLEDNEICGNAEPGVMISGGGNPTLRRNKINENGENAIWISKGGRGTFEGNDLRDNAHGAWKIDPDCLPHITRKDNIE